MNEREQQERYVRAPQLANRMGVSERTINRMVVEGMPSDTWGMKRARRFLPSQAKAWARARKVERENPLDRRDNVDEPTSRRRQF